MPDSDLRTSREILTQVPAPRVEGQRRMLTLDGGGIRGIISLKILQRLEQQLRSSTKDPKAVLADHFDYFAGTSTGALIAACLALGWPVDRVLDIYVKDGDRIFKKASIFRKALSRLGYRYEGKAVAAAIKTHVGSETVFGDGDFQALLLVITHNSKTDSPWPLSNNPHAKYNAAERADCNLRIPLWKVLRASTAAPTYFPAEKINFPEPTPDMVFVDGGVTPSNNPSLQLAMQATHPAYKLAWDAGSDRLLLVSVGTGTAANSFPKLAPRKMGLVHTAKTLPGTFMNGSSVQQDAMCRMLGHCTHGAQIDGEVGQLLGDAETRAAKMFTYVRYNAELTIGSMHDYGLDALATEARVKQLRKLDATSEDDIAAFQSVGEAAANEVDLAHAKGFLS